MLAMSKSLGKLGIWTAGLLLGIAGLAAAALPPVPPTPKAPLTLGNLQAAYQGESNAQARYLAWAQKADAEGYLKVGKMFRALAVSESLHAEKHARVILSLKGVPATKPVAPTVGTTQENLAAAIKGETYEVDTMYPAYVMQAQKDKLPAAVGSFQSAKAVEASHAQLLARALNNLAAWKTPLDDFWVCSVCGNVVDNRNFQFCPICKAPVSAYKKVS